ncbi:dCTP pyrophosphatase 1 [Pelomyxa schiedti]|nr:dCTP pyrophosphatase 1 [Pelomyxa schiedti]
MSSSPTIEQFRSTLQSFADDRDWEKYHTPRNLVLAMVGEVGELAECFQWRDDMTVGLPRKPLPFNAILTEPQPHKINQHTIFRIASATLLASPAFTEFAFCEEISDIFLYLVRLADKCGIDLPAAAERKIRLNGIKYPADEVRGSRKKYTEYHSHKS